MFLSVPDDAKCGGYNCEELNRSNYPRKKRHFLAAVASRGSVVRRGGTDTLQRNLPHGPAKAADADSP